MEQPMLRAGISFTQAPDPRDHPAHTHDHHELYCFLAGDARYAVEGTVYPLCPGDVMVMRRSESHHLMLRSAAPYRRIVVSFTPPAGAPDGLLSAFTDRPLGQDNRYPAALFGDGRWAERLTRLCAAPDPAVRSAYLTVLLWELAQSLPRLRREAPPAAADPTAAVLAFINAHLTEPLSLDLLCARFYLSRSQLSRRFRSVTGASVWDYITTKRLMLARELMAQGERPTAVYARCGFGDYVTFYRAYRRRFGTGPGDRRPSP